MYTLHLTLTLNLFLSGNSGSLEKTALQTFNRQPLHYNKSSESSLTTSSTKANFIKNNAIL